jgi:hypothetical protein
MGYIVYEIAERNLHSNDLEVIQQGGYKQGFFIFSQICKVGGLAIIHKRTWPNLATHQRGK